ncbi:hypothetical protein R1sor_010519 [Riccia sorocarpa]|uniref:Reverse transcriptase domain-containing protein n=1 Tax=Riccia sorocarpa TaxID=122646 RepID=A0ABD3HYK3_9MARC
MHTAHTPQEVVEVVDNLAHGKSPGLDGITAEVLRSCWPLVRRDCIDMVQEFWLSGALTEKTRTTVLKLLPKNDQTQQLKNWRPLSLMGVTYKILAKIMANRLKKLMPKLVDGLQTGFIEGRSIARRLCEDFTNTIPIQRGIRHGCPLAPYLFTLTPQILMDTIQEGINDKTIHGLRINQDKQLVHRLFADDTGLFLQMDEDVFRAAKDRITTFELALGALLNLQKSIIIPMGPTLSCNGGFEK